MSVDRVRDALLAAGHEDTIAAFPDGTRTAADAAAAIGCTVAQIAKSIVFQIQAKDGGGGAAIVIASGANRVDRRRASEALGLKLVVAGPDFVLAETGFQAGGVSPVGLSRPPVFLMDEDLLALDPVWAAAGTSRHVFRTTAAWLQRITGAPVAAIRVT